MSDQPRFFKISGLIMVATISFFIGRFTNKSSIPKNTFAQEIDQNQVANLPDKSTCITSQSLESNSPKVTSKKTITTARRPKNQNEQKYSDLLKAGKTKEALRHLEEVVRNDPTDIGALKELALISKFKWPEKALGYLDTILNLDPTDEKAIDDVVFISKNLYGEDDSIKRLASIVSGSQSSDYAASLLADLVSENGNPNAAIETLESAVSKSKNPLKLMAQLAPQYSDNGDFKKALETYNKISDIITDEIQRAQSNDESDLLVQNDLSRIKMEKALVLVRLNRCKDVESILSSPNLQRADQKLYRYLKTVVKRNC